MILVVEANNLSRDMIHQNLVECGFDVIDASSGIEAFAAIESRHADLEVVITDLHLDDKSGWDVARRARELNEATAIIYISGSTGDDWLTESVPRSALLSKPFTHAQLLTAISDLVQTADRQRAGGSASRLFSRCDCAFAR